MKRWNKRQEQKAKQILTKRLILLIDRIHGYLNFMALYDCSSRLDVRSLSSPDSTHEQALL